MGKPTANQLFEATHSGIDSPDDPSLFTMAELGGTPVVADSAARDALFPTPVGNEKVFNTTSRRIERYNAPTAAWVGDSSGPVVANFRDASVKPTSGNDESSALQTLVDQVAVAGGTIQCEVGDYAMNVVLKTGVHIKAQEGYGYNPSGGATRRTRFLAAATGIVVDTPAGGATVAGLHGITFVGLGAGTACKGVRWQAGNWCDFKSLSFDSFADEGFVSLPGTLAGTIEDILTTNCVLNRSRAVKIGAVDVDGTDHYLNRIEAGISGSIEGVAQSVNLYCVALAIRMTAGACHAPIGEISDVGIYIPGSLNRIYGGRADKNYGHGWEVTGTGNQIVAPLSLSNSQDTTNLYDGYSVTGVNNLFVVPLVNNQLAKVTRYGFNDQSAAGDANKNYYLKPLVVGTVGTAEYNHAAGASAAFDMAEGPPRTLTANSTTPSVQGYKDFLTANSSPTTITDFTRGVNGQVIVIECADVNTTIQHNGSTIVTPGAGNIKLRTASHYMLQRRNGVWRLITEDPSQILNVSADNGDAIKTLQYRRDEPTQIWATALTANRAVTLSTTGAQAGAQFDITRTAASTGASTLDVGTGPLKSLAPGQWCVVKYNGAAWYLDKFGSL